MKLEDLPGSEREVLVAAVDRYADLGPFTVDELIHKLRVVYRAALPSLFGLSLSEQRACLLAASREVGERRARVPR